MVKKSQIRNRVRQMLYRPGKSRVLSGDVLKSFETIDKTVQGGLNGILKEMGFNSEEKDEDESDDND